MERPNTIGKSISGIHAPTAPGASEPSRLTPHHQHSEGRCHGDEVQEDRLHRNHDGPEHDQQQEEGEPQHEAEDVGQRLVHGVGEVHADRGQAGNIDLSSAVVEGIRDDLRPKELHALFRCIPVSSKRDPDEEQVTSGVHDCLKGANEGVVGNGNGASRLLPLSVHLNWS